jgi:hypothetical protein
MVRLYISLIGMIVFVSGCLTDTNKEVIQKELKNYKLESFKGNDIFIDSIVSYYNYFDDSSRILEFQYFEKEDSVVFVRYEELEFIKDSVLITGYNKERNKIYSYLVNKRGDKKTRQYRLGKYYIYYWHLRYELSENQKKYYRMFEDSILNNLDNYIPNDSLLSKDSVWTYRIGLNLRKSDSVD